MTIAPQQCLHQHYAFSECNACVVSCPHSAVALSEADDGPMPGMTTGAIQPVIDSACCTQCGFCQSACPADVFEFSATSILSRKVEAGIVTLVCAASGSAHPNLSCLRAVSLSSLADLYDQGARNVVFCVGHCQNCQYGGDNLVDLVYTTIRQFNHYLGKSGLASLVFSATTVAEFDAHNKLDNSAGARRQFLRKLARHTGEHLLHINKGQMQADVKPSRLTALEKLQALGADAQTGFYTPWIDENLCTACGSCSRVCPHEAISFPVLPDDEPILAVNPAQCTGCRLCESICEPQAISLMMQSHKGHVLALHRFHCRRCGVAHYQLNTQAPRDNAESLCHICAARPDTQDQKLFQVYQDL